MRPVSTSPAEAHLRPHDLGLGPVERHLDAEHLGGHSPRLLPHGPGDALHLAADVEVGPRIEPQRHTLPHRNAARRRPRPQIRGPASRVRSGMERTALRGPDRVSDLLLLAVPVGGENDDAVLGRTHRHSFDGLLQLAHAASGPVAPRAERRAAPRSSVSSTAWRSRVEIPEVALASVAVEARLLGLDPLLHLGRNVGLEMSPPELGLALRRTQVEIEPLHGGVHDLLLEALLGLLELGPLLVEQRVAPDRCRRPRRDRPSSRLVPSVARKAIFEVEVVARRAG